MSCDHGINHLARKEGVQSDARQDTLEVCLVGFANTGQ